MWIVGLICIIAIAFLLACLRGFHAAAVRQKHTVWAVLVIAQEDIVVELPQCKPSPVSFPRSA
jgi:hypothetical protein